MYADIIIPLALPKTYTWSVPESLADLVRPGVRVEVGLGKNKKYSGIVRQVHHNGPAYETKDILNVLDTQPVVSETQLKLWEWMAGYYMCSEGEVMAAALPAHFKLSSETIITFNEEAGDDFTELDNDEYVVAEALSVKKQLTVNEAQELLDNVNAYTIIRRLIEKRICFVWESLKETFIPKKETYVRLNPVYGNEDRLADLLNNWARAPKQMELLLAYLHLLKTETEVTKASLLKKSNASEAQLKGLIDKEILFIEKKNIDRLRYLPRAINIDFALTPAQQTAFENIRETFNEHAVCLLHGVTSSGKTQLYIKLIEAFLEEGKQVLYLLPEIALTSQIIRRLEKHFGGYIGIYHSKFSQNERIEIWNKTRKGELRVILGARSSLFLPFTELGLVIVDEEHDTSYKQQEPAPRYNARDAAVFYASLTNAKVLLGSATPSVESYYNAIRGKYGMVELKERYGGVALPEIEIIDMKKAARTAKEKTILSDSLKDQIEDILQQNKQVILFQNRRGYAPYQICQVCGWIPHCRNCDVTLTFHKKTHKLHCHYCGQVYPPVHVCQACGSDKFLQRSFGTEKIEEQLEDVFPQAHIARMDVDSVRGKNAHDQLIRNFEQGKVDILVGTQMVVKGLDFENVQLVGVLDADSLLNFADFRVNERAFQLIGQVSGRAGRKDEQGRVVIQATNTSNPLLPLIQMHDYRAFFEVEIEMRKRFFYPPFSRLILLTFRHKEKDVVELASQFFAERMAPLYGRFLVGPAEPVVNRVRNQFLMELLIKLPKDSQMVKSCKQFILDQVAVMHAEKRLRNVVVIPDVDR
jgi:primosomal protein N' (replication factor Y)